MFYFFLPTWHKNNSHRCPKAARDFSITKDNLKLGKVNCLFFSPSEGAPSSVEFSLHSCRVVTVLTAMQLSAVFTVEIVWSRRHLKARHYHDNSKGSNPPSSSLHSLLSIQSSLPVKPLNYHLLTPSRFISLPHRSLSLPLPLCQYLQRFPLTLSGNCVLFPKLFKVQRKAHIHTHCKMAIPSKWVLFS